MADFKRLDKMEQFKVTNAVQKAANLALVSEDDRSKILADQLTKDNVPRELTKLATDAFNRRISVVTLGKRTDADKAEDFPLADFNKVASLRGCNQDGVTKTASLHSSQYVFNIQKPTMVKTAGAPVKREMPDISIQQYMKKVQSLLDIAASQLEQDIRNINKQQDHLQHILTKSAQMLAKDTKTSKILSTVYGDTYTNLYKNRLPAEALEKHASYAILPKSIAVQLTEKAIHQSDLVHLKKDMLMLKKAKISRMAEAAQELQSFVSKGILSGMIKNAAGRYSLMKDIAGNVVSAPIMAAINTGAGALSQADRTLAALNEYNSKQFSISPSDVISPRLINQQLLQSKKQRVIDMLANPDFAKYRAEEIEKAVQDSLQDNKALLSSGNRGYLKSDVATRLLSDNRTNKADQAATAKLMKDVTETQKLRQQSAPERAVERLTSVDGGGNKLLGEALGLRESISQAKDAKPLFVNDLSGRWDQISQQAKQYAKQHMLERQKQMTEKIKDLAGYAQARKAAINSMALSNLKSNRQIQRQLAAQGINWKKLDTIDKLTVGQKLRLLQATEDYFQKLTPDSKEKLLSIPTESKKKKGK